MLSGAQELSRHMSGVVSGEQKAIHWPWECITKLTRSLKPGSVTVLAGAPGASKSFSILQCLHYWSQAYREWGTDYEIGGYEDPVSCHLLALEGEKHDHLRRYLAYLEGNSCYLDDDWVGRNEQQVHEAQERHLGSISTMANCITCTCGLGQTTHDDVINFLDHTAQWNRIVVVDPITASYAGERQWTGDQKLINKSKNIAADRKASIIFVTHPSKLGTTPDMSSVAGGAAYQQFTDCMLWLKSFHPPKEMSVRTACGTLPTELNRAIYVLKARHGPGAGYAVGFNFNERLSMAERGVIRKEEKK